MQHANRRAGFIRPKRNIHNDNVAANAAPLHASSSGSNAVDVDEVNDDDMSRLHQGSSRDRAQTRVIIPRSLMLQENSVADSDEEDDNDVGELLHVPANSAARDR